MFALVFAACSACAHLKSATDAETLRAAAETFHQRIRWRDFRGAGELIVPERRAAFQSARESLHDERDLSITDYHLEDVRLSPEGDSAVVVSRLSWTRLPSLSESSDLISSEFVRRDGTWLIAQQDGGPFAAELKGSAKGAKTAP